MYEKTIETLYSKRDEIERKISKQIATRKSFWRWMWFRPATLSLLIEKLLQEKREYDIAITCLDKMDRLLRLSAHKNMTIIMDDASVCDEKLQGSLIVGGVKLAAVESLTVECGTPSGVTLRNDAPIMGKRKVTVDIELAETFLYYLNHSLNLGHS